MGRVPNLCDTGGMIYDDLCDPSDWFVQEAVKTGETSLPVD